MSPSKTDQSLSSHTRYDPLFHFFAVPVFALTVALSIARAIRFPTPWRLWLVVVSCAALLCVFLFRTYSLKVQDRLIRLEERLRLASLGREETRGRLPELTTPQLIALRFASDEELPELAHRALMDNLSAKQIKQAIQVWRPDQHRV